MASQKERNDRMRTKKAKHIPPPPGAEAGYDEIIAYCSKYSLDELEKAGYAREVPRELEEEVTASAAYQMLCRDGLHLKLPRKDYELLSRLAARKAIAVATLAKRWIGQGLEQEAKQLAAGHSSSALRRK
jgi:hypothetical protein